MIESRDIGELSNKGEWTRIRETAWTSLTNAMPSKREPGSMITFYDSIYLIFKDSSMAIDITSVVCLGGAGGRKGP